MPEYVYALHDFQPEHEDEVSFKAGERIEVIEKDDAFGDGWWQGRNMSGKVGLFPQTYTTSSPPADSVATASSNKDDEDEDEADNKPSQESTLQPLHEESERESSPVPKGPAIYVNGTDADGEMMRATMTDVQQAIEQLGRPRSNSVDEDRSFSFASSRHTDTDNDTDTDLDLEDGDDAGEWHKDARRRLAEKARKAVEEAEKLEAMMNGRSSAPPIAVELSDESEGEDEDEEEGDYTKSSAYFRRHSRIPEEDEEEEEISNRPTHSPLREEELTVPEREEPEVQTATATRTTFPASASVPANMANEPPVVDPAHNRSLPTPVSPGFSVAIAGSSSPSTTTVTPTPAPPSPVPATGLPTELKRDSNTQITGLPSPTTSSASTTPFHFSAPTSDHSSAPSSSVVATPTPSVPDKTTSEKEKTHPSEWTVDDVIDWLKSKGFDQDVCEKFTEQEITGDVLLDLDVNVLKNEIGIMAFGKRVRIANAITELKRPPSINYPDSTNVMNGPPSPVPPGSAGFAQYLQHSPQTFAAQSPQSGSFTNTHSRHQSIAQSHHSFPGSIAGGVAGSTKDSYSVHSAGGALFTAGSGPGFGELTSSPLSAGVTKGLSSPSDSALAEKVEEEGDDHGALSEGEGNAASQRRRLFGRSHDSAASDGKKSSRHSKDGTTEDEKKDGDKDSKEGSVTSRHRPKKSLDGGKGEHSRLSIFGGTFAGSLGKQKHRKPPPRYSSYEEADAAAQNDKSTSGSAFHLPKFATGPRKVSSGRPGSSSGLKPKDGETKETRDPTLLRKRTSSYPGPGSASSHGSNKDKKESVNGKEKEKEKEKKSDAANGHGISEKGAAGEVQSPLKPGQSILDQIGEPDHIGWMRKKGDRYNSWKLRYFVLKGHHLYCLKSDSHAETKIKGYINIVGYKVTVDENVNPGKYGFRIDHDNDKTHYFSSDEKNIIRDWMKAIMKATIGRDYTKPVISSFNAPTIPLMVAQAMNPAPRPPSPTAREATQKALRRENPNQLSSRDARVLMGLPGSENKDERGRLDSFFSDQPVTSETSKESPKGPVPPRPSREGRRSSVTHSIPPIPSDDTLFEWANTHLPSSLQINPNIEPLCGGLALLRVAESIKGRPASPPVSDSAFPRDLNDDKLDGFFRLFDFLLDNDVKMGSVSINDVRTGKRDKIIQLLKGLKGWEDKRRAIAQSIGKGSVQAGPFIAGV